MRSRRIAKRGGASVQRGSLLHWTRLQNAHRYHSVRSPNPAEKVAYWKNATFSVNIAPSPISSPRAAYAAGLARCSVKQGFEHLRSVAKR